MNDRPRVAVIRFRAEPGHRHAPEIRAHALTRARRGRPEGGRKPVVRDRGTDAPVGSEPAREDAGASPCR